MTDFDGITRDDVRELVKEIKMLKDEMHVLKNEVRDLRIMNGTLIDQISDKMNGIDELTVVKIKFDNSYFLNNQTVEYLQACDLDYEARCTLLGNFTNLCFVCTKYLIRCWTNGTYDWNEKYQFGSDIYNFAHFVGRKGNETVVKYFLDICIVKNLDLEQKTENGVSLLQIFYVNANYYRIIDHVIDIWIGNNLDMYSPTQDGNTFLHKLCTYGTYKQIKRVVNVYIEKNYNLGHKNLGGKNCLQLCFINNRSSVLIKFMANTYVEQKISICDSNQTFLKYVSPLERGSLALCLYLKCLEKDIFVNV